MYFKRMYMTPKNYVHKAQEDPVHFVLFIKNDKPKETIFPQITQTQTHTHTHFFSYTHKHTHAHTHTRSTYLHYIDRYYTCIKETLISQTSNTHTHTHTYTHTYTHIHSLSLSHTHTHIICTIFIHIIYVYKTSSSRKL